MVKGIQLPATDTHVDMLVSFSCPSQYPTCPMSSLSLAASQCSPKSSHPLHLPAVLPYFLCLLPLPKSTST